jgi:peptide chain release factor 3
MVYPKFDRQDYRRKTTTCLFGSALNNFGVENYGLFCSNAPSPRPKIQKHDCRSKEEKMSGFVFKIHANMDPKHRDSLAFIKLFLEHLKETNRIITYVKRT